MDVPEAVIDKLRVCDSDELNERLEDSVAAGVRLCDCVNDSEVVSVSEGEAVWLGDELTEIVLSPLGVPEQLGVSL